MSKTSFEQEHIAAAAIMVDGLTLTLPRPSRHGDIIRAADIIAGGADFSNQGFITSQGRFVGRIAAKAMARDAGQTFLPGHHKGPELFSEDLW